MIEERTLDRARNELDDWVREVRFNFPAETHPRKRYYRRGIPPHLNTLYGLILKRTNPIFRRLPVREFLRAYIEVMELLDWLRTNAYHEPHTDQEIEVMFETHQALREDREEPESAAVLAYSKLVLNQAMSQPVTYKLRKP